MSSDMHDLLSRMADELDNYRQLLTDDRREVHALASEARAALAAAPESAVKQSLTTAPPAPLEGEVGELIAQLKSYAEYGAPIRLIPFVVARAANLLEQLAAAAPAVVPVAVSERPWERPGWCDAWGRFWAEHISRSGITSWMYATAADIGGWAVRCLPAHAIPLPAPQGGEGEA